MGALHTKRRQVAVASSVVVAGAMLWLLAAQRAHAAGEAEEATTVAAATTANTELLPTNDPCGSCGNSSNSSNGNSSNGNSSSNSNSNSTQLAQAARPPAGAAMPQDLPRTPAPPPTFRLNDIRLNGAQALSADELKTVTQPYIGRDVALADLEALAKAITDLYRARGYFLA
ncbi:POTRA domain-containing protein, partial [Variovorax sp. dw_308]|uniref:POTRA domain-containing protein n=1 Tax=Variovorax sp. dw_308 TaxID=2721546 RepID=UPI00273798E9